MSRRGLGALAAAGVLLALGVVARAEGPSPPPAGPLRYSLIGLSPDGRSAAVFDASSGQIYRLEGRSVEVIDLPAGRATVSDLRGRAPGGPVRLETPEAAARGVLLAVESGDQLLLARCLSRRLALSRPLPALFEAARRDFLGLTPADLAGKVRFVAEDGEWRLDE